MQTILIKYITFPKTKRKSQLCFNIWIFCILEKTFDFSSLHIWTYSSFEGNYFYLAADVARRNKDVRRQEQTEREAGMGRKGVLVSHICREPAVFCLDFLSFSLCCCSGRFTNPTCGYLTSWELDSSLSCLCGVFRKSWDKSYWFYLKV